MNRTARVSYAAVLIWTFAATFLRAVRPPNDFAEAQWLLDYRFGFVKRGLAGTLLSLASSVFGARPSEDVIAAVAYTALAAFALVLAAVSIRLVANLQWSPAAILVTLVFASSPFIVMSAHLVGYYDHLFIVLTVLSCALLVGGRPWLAGSLAVAAILIHESSLLVGVPVFCLTWWLVNRRREISDREPMGIWPLLMPIAMFLAITIVQHALMPDDFESAYSAHLSQFDFVQNDRHTMVPDYMTAPFLEYFSKSETLKRIMHPTIPARILPSLAAFIAFVLTTYYRRVWSAESALFVGVCLVPQLMHAVAWDTERIWTYSVVCGFLATWIHTEVHGPGRRTPWAVMWLALIVIVANSVTTTPLMDNERDRFALATRAILYLPTIAAAGALVARGRRDSGYLPKSGR